MSQKPKLTPSQKQQLGLIYMQEYTKKLNATQAAMCVENAKDPNRKVYSWDEFWQTYNALWNIGQYEAVLLHLRMNYLNGYNRGKF